MPPEQTVHDGPGALDALRAYLDAGPPRRVALVADAGAYPASGAERALGPSLGRHAVECFTGFRPNPQFDDLAPAVTRFQAFAPDTFLAVGGGTAIDCAKTLRWACEAGITLEQVLDGVSNADDWWTPFWAVPTTAGSGSEATRFAVLYHLGQKHSLAHPDFVPTHVVLDARLTASLPRAVTVASGLDALCQGIESFWAVGATPASQESSRRAVALAVTALPEAADGLTLESRQQMLQASHLAGRAINIAKTTAPHALSYSLTSQHHVPHGFAVALTLGEVFDRHRRATDAGCRLPGGGAELAARLGELAGLVGLTSPDDFLPWWRAFLVRLGAPTRLSDCGIPAGAIPSIAGAVNAERLGNNPVALTEADLRALLLKLA